MSELFENEKSLPENLPTVELYTDGACLGNPGPGGWAYVLKYPESGEVVENYGGEARTTNNRMELLAVIEGIKAVGKPARVHLVADSVYVVKGIKEWLPGWKAKGWRTASKKPVKNKDLWEEMDALLQEYDVVAGWTKGHAGHVENERCDQLASAEAERIKMGY